MSQEIEKLLSKQAHLIDSTIQKYIPRKFEKNSTVFILNPPRYAFDLEALNRTIAKPIWEFLDRGGKRWRPALFLLICEALGKNSRDFLDFAVIPEVIHNGTLILDDIEDDSIMRRGKPCIHRLFGLDIAVNLGNEILFLPLLVLIGNKSKLPKEKINDLYEIYVQEMINVGFGQGIDISWHKGLIPIDNIKEEDYFQMCAYKTGTLARMAARMAATLADADNGTVEKFGKFAEAIGIAFQIQDDVLDLVSQEFAEGKGGVAHDITEGKRSLMVIYTVNNATQRDRKRLVDILNMHTANPELKIEAINILKKYHAIEYAKQMARKIVEDSWDEVSKVLPPSEAKQYLRAFADYLVSRPT